MAAVDAADPPLFHTERTEINDPKVADNTGRDDFVTEGEEILFGTNFGIVTDIQTGPDGGLYLVSPSQGAVLKIFRSND
jgi:aldose sugar dehydrogenase